MLLNLLDDNLEYLYPLKLMQIGCELLILLHT